MPLGFPSVELVPLQTYYHSLATTADLETDDMDKKLLLTIQSVCNAEGVKIPWDKVGAIMGQHISDGAVIQHLAKLRSRMVTQGLDVPPPLRRGGGTIISTGPSGGGSSGSKPSPVKAAKQTSKKYQAGVNFSDNDDEGVEYDVDKASDSEEEYEQPRSKRSKRGANSEYATVKSENDEFSKPTKVSGDKRKRNSSSFGVETGRKNKNSEKDAGRREKATTAQIKSEDQTTNSTIKFEENDQDNSEDDDRYKSENQGSDDVEGVQYVGSGAHYLRLKSQSESPMKRSTQDLKEEKPGILSKIVVLPLPSHRKNSDFERYPQTPEYKVQPDSEFKVGFEAGTNHIFTPNLTGTGVIVKDEALVMGSAAGDGSAIQMRPIVNMNSSVNMRSAFEEALVSQHPLEYPTYESPRTPYRDRCLPSTTEQGNFGYSSTAQNSNGSPLLSNTKTVTFQNEFGNPRTGQAFDMCLSSSNVLPSNSSFYDSGGYQYMRPIQSSNFDANAPTDSFDYTGFGTPEFGMQGITHSHHPNTITTYEPLDGNQNAQQYGAQAKDGRFDPRFVRPSQPTRPSVSVVTRQPDQPNVVNEPFSGISTKTNPTPILATAGDANGEPVLDFTQYLHDDFEESLLNPMTSADMIAEFDKKDYAGWENDGEGNGGVI